MSSLLSTLFKKTKNWKVSKDSDLPLLFTATRFLVIIANRTLKQAWRRFKRLSLTFGSSWENMQVLVSPGSLWPAHSPRFFHGEAVDSQNPAQSVLSAVHHVLLLLVIQLLLHDVPTEVEHHLQGHQMHHGTNYEGDKNIPLALNNSMFLWLLRSRRAATQKQHKSSQQSENFHPRPLSLNKKYTFTQSVV